MHPDLAADDEARGHAEAFMKRLNTAYRAGDAEAIVNLLEPVGGLALRRRHADDAVRTSRRLGALGNAVTRAEERLEELRSSELAQLLDRAMATAATGGDLLADMRRDAEAALMRARARLTQLEA